MSEITQPQPFTLAEKIENTRSPDFFKTYANNVALQANYYDITLTFGESSGLTQKEDGAWALNVEQKVQITMALRQAKILSVALMNQVLAYENRFGKLDIPSELIPPELHPYFELFGIQTGEEPTQ